MGHGASRENSNPDQSPVQQDQGPLHQAHHLLNTFDSTWTQEKRFQLLRDPQVCIQLITNGHYSFIRRAIPRALLLHFSPDLEQDLRVERHPARDDEILTLQGPNLLYQPLRDVIAFMKLCATVQRLDDRVWSRWYPSQHDIQWTNNAYMWKILDSLRLFVFARVYHATLLQQVQTKKFHREGALIIFRVLGRDSHIVHAMIERAAEKAIAAKNKSEWVVIGLMMVEDPKLNEMFHEKKWNLYWAKKLKISEEEAETFRRSAREGPKGDFDMSLQFVGPGERQYTAERIHPTETDE